MYTAIMVILFGIAALLFMNGWQKRRRGRMVAGVLISIFTILFFQLLDFWGEMLWFEVLGYSQRFWIAILNETGWAIAGALAGGILVYALTFSIPRERRLFRKLAAAFGALLGIFWGIGNWETILQYWQRVPAGISDPVLGKDASFYLFVLPLYNVLYFFLLLITVLALIATLSGVFVRIRRTGIDIDSSADAGKDRAHQHGAIYLNGALILLVLAAGKYLNRYHLMYSEWGAVSGAGWTDVHIRLPAYLIVSGVTALLGLLMLIPPARRKLSGLKGTCIDHAYPSPLTVFAVLAMVVAALWFLALTVVPKLFQWLRVEPNEITFEEPYIANNIQFTRYGFKLQEVEEREFPVSGELTREMIENNANLFENIRLWDWRALDAVYKQFQEIRLYYEFVDVDIDRYTIGERYRQVMVSARELELNNLPQQSQTFVNRRFKYTHGYGLTLTKVSEFTSQGLPNLLIKDIPPKNNHPELAVERPQLYYGELTRSPVVVNSREEEFDYPSGEKNVYIRYPGKGGVQLSNLWRKFVYGWIFDGTRFFLSNYPTGDSRIMFHRQIIERVKSLAPFLHFDEDPYVVLFDGQLYWLIDGYTTSSYFPYSEPFSSREIIEYKEGNLSRSISEHRSAYLHGVNYLRNSVKAVVNAFDGTVDFYIFEETDPLIRVWAKIFPDLFKKESEMPDGLRKHIRYPLDMLLVQGLVYAKYHMSNPAVFYNQEDLWVRATEKYYRGVQPVEPYYIMWQLPESREPEFVLILPFTPKNRQVLIGWIAGLCDGENYGRFLAYKFPKEKRVLGPQQVETKIDQDRFLSGQLTLWDQRGSNVIRGNVLAIPVAGTLIYVEPIYLQAETAAYPELRLVAVMHGDRLSYAESFDKALRGMFGEGEGETFAADTLSAGSASLEELVRQASGAFNDFLKHQNDRQFMEAARALETLEITLQKLTELTSETAGKERSNE